MKTLNEKLWNNVQLNYCALYEQINENIKLKIMILQSNIFMLHIKCAKIVCCMLCAIFIYVIINYKRPFTVMKFYEFVNLTLSKCLCIYIYIQY